MVNELDLHYPPDACPFCNIAAAYPSSSASPLWSPSETSLSSCIPSDTNSNPEKTTPSSFIVLSSPDVIAFLDILPMTGGHLLVASREHRLKVADLRAGESREVGMCSKGVLKKRRKVQY
jgi:diadenosine tetraphosphate (Ap4A) HIT family hydrolase